MLTNAVGEFLVEHLGLGPYFVLAAMLQLLVPMLLVAAIAVPWSRGTRGTGYGLLAGFAFALWASLCYLVVPWVGLYPNLPGVCLAAVVDGVGEEATWVGELCVHLVNFVLWPLLGWVLFRLPRPVSRRRLVRRCA
jgi:hypothetical protein